MNAKNYTHQPTVPQLISQRLVERLEDLHHFKPYNILDLGCGAGYMTKLLHKMYSNSRIVGVDSSSLLLEEAKKLNLSNTNYIHANINNPPLADNTFDLICANLSFLWLQDLSQYFIKVKQWLKPGGLLLFSSLGVDTFNELSSEKNLTYSSSFLDIHSVGDVLTATKWQEVVMDVDRFLVKYKDFHSFYISLQKEQLDRLIEQPLLDLLSKQSYHVTWEVVYGQAWKTNIEKDFSENGDICIPINQLFLSTQS